MLTCWKMNAKTLLLLVLVRGTCCFSPVKSSRHSLCGIVLESSADAFDESTPPLRPPSALPHRPRHLRKAKKKKKSSNHHDAILTDQDLADHVSMMYIHGPYGILRDRASQTTAGNQEYLRMLDQHPALVLNADYQPMSYLPLSMWHWQEAIKAVFSGKVTVVDVYENVNIRAVNLEIPLPSVIAVNDYVPQFAQTPAFTKRNVFLRDEYRCQYCNNRFHTNELSLDHVIPRSRGGRLHWENAVTCCHKCNGRKGSLTVRELKSVNMRLLREPRVPSQFELAAIAGRMLPRSVHSTWEPYLGIQTAKVSPAAGKTKRPAANVSRKKGEAVLD